MATPELKVAITADNTTALASLQQFSSAVKGAAIGATTSMEGLAKSFSGLITPITTVAGLVGGGSLFASAVSRADDLNKEVSQLQRLFGGTTIAAAATRLAIKEVYGDAEAYAMASTKLVAAINTREKAVKSLGVTTRDASGHIRSLTELMPEVIQAIGDYATAQDRDAAAQQVFGESFAQILKYINMTPAALATAKKHAQDFGLELDDQEKSTIKTYKSAVVVLNEAFEGLGVQVGIAVMPQLTELANLLSGAAPAAIRATSTALKVLTDLLSNTAIQVVIGAVALQSTVSVLTTLATKLPLVTTALQIWKFQMAAAAMTGTTGLAAVAVSAKGTGSALLGMINPWVLAGVAVVAVAAQLVWFSQAAKRAADAAKRASAEARESAQGWATLANSTAVLDNEMRKSSTSADRRVQLQAQLALNTKELVKLYPNLNNYLQGEAGHQRNLAEAIKMANDERLRTLEIEAKGLSNIAEGYKKEIDQRKQWNTSASADIGSGRLASTNQVVNKRSEMAYNDREIKKLEDMYVRAQRLSEDKTAELNILKAAGKPGSEKHWLGSGDGDKSKTISQAELELRLQKSRLDAMTEYNLQQQEAKAVEKERLSLEEQRVKLNNEAASGAISGDIARAEYAALKATSDKKIALIHSDYNAKRLDLEKDLQEQVTDINLSEEDKRIAAIEKKYDEIRKKNATLGSNAMPEFQIESAQGLEILQTRMDARLDKDKKDLDELKKELAGLAQAQGYGVSANQKKEIYGRYNSAGKGNAVASYKAETHEGEGAKSGVLAGINESIDQNTNMWGKWRSFTVDQISSVESSVSNLFQTMLQHGTTGAQKWNALWKGISGSALKALSDIAAQELINWGIDKAKALWHTMSTAKKIGETTAETAAKVSGAAATSVANTAEATTSMAATTGNTAKATSGFFAAYSGIPWVGYALAIASIVAMGLVLSKITAHAKGGVIDGPTLALMGEVPGSTEIVANEHDFLAWADKTANTGYNLGHSLAKSDANVADLASKSAAYGQQAISSDGPQTGGYQDYRGALIVTTSSREWADAVQVGLKTHGRSRG